MYVLIGKACKAGFFFAAVSSPEKKFAYYIFLQRDTAVSFPAKPGVSWRVVYSGQKFLPAETAAKSTRQQRNSGVQPPLKKTGSSRRAFKREAVSEKPYE
jgi:hypothetical protein